MKLEFDLDSYVDKIKKDSGNSYFHTFIDRDNLAVGVLILEPGKKDSQVPHDSDEVYYVISGNGFLKIRDKDYKITKDKLYFVGAGRGAFFSWKHKRVESLYFFGGASL